MDLSIIILSYNTKDLLKQTIDSIELKESWELIVVDNASKDGSSQMVEADYPQITLVKNSRNLGFAAGNNIGIQLAKGRYVLLLNSDTKIVKDSLQILVDYLDTHPNVGAITPKVVLPDGAIDLACHRGMPTPWRAFSYFSKLEQLFPNSKRFGGYHLTHLNFEKTHPVEATAATAMMVRRDVIDQIGMLDEQFFFYAEDLDWCKRITEAGWGIVYHPKAVVVHFKSQSGKQNKNKAAHRMAKKHFYDTMKQFYEKHYTKDYSRFTKRVVYWAIDLKKWLSTRF